jgi:hypothetical protein
MTAIVKTHSDKFIWRLIMVYGSPYDETKLEFVNELHMVMGLWQGPTLVGGDFNLVRYQKEKNNGAFNDCKLGLAQMVRFFVVEPTHSGSNPRFDVGVDIYG